MRSFVAILVIGAVVIGGAWSAAGRAAGPTLQIRQPGTVIGQSSPLEIAVETPGGRLSRLDIVIQQGDKLWVLYTLNGNLAERQQQGADRVVLTRHVGKKDVPELKPGPARIVVRAARPVLRGLRQATAEVTKDVQVRLEPPRVEVLSTFHYINKGGAEFVVYRATPPDVDSGVRVGDQSYPGFSGTAVGIQRRGDSCRVFCPGLRSGPERADNCLCAGSGRQ